MKPLRFRLKTLVLILTVSGVSLGLIGAKWRAARQRDIVRSEVKRLKGRLVVNAKKKERRLLLAGDQVTDSELEKLLPKLRFFPELTELDLVSAPVTDKSLVSIANLSQLELLHVYETMVTEAGLKSLQQKRPRLVIKETMPDPVASALVSRKIYRHAIISLAISDTENQRQVVTGDGDGNLSIWHSDLSQSVQRKAHDNWAFAAEFNHAGTILASGGGDDQVLLWSTDDWKPVAISGAAEGDVHAMAFSPDDRFLFTTGDDMMVRRIDLSQTPPMVVEFGDHEDTVPTLALDPQGKWLATGSRDHTICIWNAQTGHLERTIEGHDDDVVGVMFHPTRPWLVSASYDKTVRIWDFQSGKELQRLIGHKERIFDVRWSPSGSQIATAAEDGVLVWHADSYERHISISHSTPVSRIRYAPDGKSLYFVDADGFITSIDAASGQSLHRGCSSRFDLTPPRTRGRVSASVDRFRATRMSNG